MDQMPPPHSNRGGCKPSTTGPPRSGPHPGREVERSIGGERSDQNRQRDENGIMKGRLVMHFGQL